jgi:hypothetical protein
MDKSLDASPPATLVELGRKTNGFPRALAECERAIADGVTAASPLALALNLWATVHGIVSLRICMPVPDWPPVAEQLDLMAAQLRGLQPARKPVSGSRQTGAASH